MKMLSMNINVKAYGSRKDAATSASSTGSPLVVTVSN
jgi:hypothetical protein